MPEGHISLGMTAMPLETGIYNRKYVAGVKRFHASVRKMGESHNTFSFFLSILPPQYIKDLSVSVSFIHDHFNLSCHHLFPGLCQLSPHQSPCLYSSSYIQIPFPSDFFFDHESFRRVLTFPSTWKIGRFFFPYHFVFSFHCTVLREHGLFGWSVSISQGVLVASYAITF